MEKLFGLPLNDLMIALIIVFGIGVLVMSVLALRNRVVFRMGARNVPRRRAQTMLIVMGLMLATLLFSASFATGDTVTNSIRMDALTNLGRVDMSVQSETTDSTGRRARFDEDTFITVQLALAGVPEVDGVAPLLTAQAPVLNPATLLSDPVVNVLGMNPFHMEGFDDLVDADGNALPLSNLGPGEVLISAATAEETGATTGSEVSTFFGAQPTQLTVAGVYESGGNPAGPNSMVLPLAMLQELTGAEGQVTSVIISNAGGPLEGADHTDTVTAAIEPALQGTDLEVRPLKQDALNEADAVGSSFATIFLVFAQFSIATGILLIFLIFVMLAAERKRELGIARAIGMQRGHVVRLFAFEGALYALIAAAVGSVLGVAVGWGMVSIMAVAFQELEFELAYTFNWRTLVIAYTLGMAVTFIVVLISSWRVSRLNIVRAVRDIPEPRSGGRRNLRGLILAVLLPVLGAFLAFVGLQEEQAGLYMLGTSLVIIGVPLLLLRFGLNERLAYTIAGVALVAWWLTPADVMEPITGEMQQGIELFFLSGIMIVLGGVWAVMYNSDLLLKAIILVFGRVRGLTPVLKIAVSHPMQNRFRTGVTVAMFSLVVFTLMVMAFIIHAIAGVFEDTERLSGGFDVSGSASYLNPIEDIRAALQKPDGVSLEDFVAIAALSNNPVNLVQDGTGNEPVDFVIRGVDAGYTEAVTYGFVTMAEEYTSDEEVWQALHNEPDTVVVANYLVPSRTDFDFGDVPPEFQLEGFFRSDPLPEVHVVAQDPLSGTERRLRVIGVTEELAFYGAPVMASQATVDSFVDSPMPPLSFMFRTVPGVDAEAAAQALETRFLANGMQTAVLEEEIRSNAATSLMLNNLLQGFMALGLVVGIAALGVIAARSVVERRQQIGMMRALGFQKGMVQLSFLIESSFIALVGIGLGIALGAGLAPQIVNEISREVEGARLIVPWTNIILVVVVAYGAALLTTFLPARQASRIYPAEALRYE
ncbi:MAG: FtsX-like permease family protein [Dehalococcoidia bacterium]